MEELQPKAKTKAKAVKEPKAKAKKAVKKDGEKKALNPFFTKMLEAKKSGAESFEYNGARYLGTKHPKLGMVYKKDQGVA